MSGWESQRQVSLEVKTVPADADPYALRVARQAAEWFRTAGIDVQVTPMSEQELFRRVLLDREFDLFVARLPRRFRTPDSLYSLLHSRFVETPGWQNPFGYANLEVNELLETQRRATGERRAEAVAQLQRTVARTQPFTVVAFPDDIRAARTDRFEGWRGADLRSPTGYLSLDRAAAPLDRTSGDDDGTGDDGTGGDGTGGGDGSGADGSGSDDDAGDAATLRTAVTDRRGTSNLNPLAVEFRGTGVLTGLLYDSLGYATDRGTVEPWLAESWAVDDAGLAPRAEVTLRAGATWHDGQPLTAEDVAFTYDLLADTALGERDGDGADGGDDGNTETEADGGGRVPAPRFQGRSSLVDEVRPVDEHTVEVRFVECAPDVAVRAFTVPVLPKHVWADRTGPVSLGGIEFGPATEALVTNNVPPVGSGPLRFVRNNPRESLVLERFEEHFLVGGPSEDLPADLAGGPAFDRLALRVVGSDVSAVGVVADGDADVTGTAVGADTVPRIGRADDTDLVVDERSAPYVVGYDAFSPPLTNPQFRHTLARLFDRKYLVEEVFSGYAWPAVSPLAGTDWLPADLRWAGSDPVTPFLGADGSVDAERAREAFREAGYSYDGDRLVRRER